MASQGPSEESDRQRGGGGGNLYLTCLRIRFEERGSWSKALQPQVDSGQADTGEGDHTPEGSASPSKPLKDNGQLLTVPPRCEEDSSSSNSSPSRKLRSKLCQLAFGYASEHLLLQQSDVTASGFWGRALGGNDVAAKRPGELGEDGGGRAMTAKPLRPLRGHTHCRSARGLPPARASYYFELEVLQTELATNQTLALGFCWHRAGLRMQDPLPTELFGSFLLGGELPRALFGDTEVCRPVGWRPLVHVVSGSRVGALLEVRDHVGGKEMPLLRLSIIQDGTLRAEAAIWSSTLPTLTEESKDAVLAAVAGKRPYGLVQVCGSVTSVRLCTDITEPPSSR